MIDLLRCGQVVDEEEEPAALERLFLQVSHSSLRPAPRSRIRCWIVELVLRSESAKSSGMLEELDVRM